MMTRFPSRNGCQHSRWVDAPNPTRIGVEEAQKAAREEAVYYHTRSTGSSNSVAKAKLGFVSGKLLWKNA
jgi:hypothetical protein